MMLLREAYLNQGASLASDGIPLHFGDLTIEYEAALNKAVIFDRSHEGRLSLTGKDRLELLNRMSTNDLLNIQVGQGKPTIFTNANARILDRVDVFSRADEEVLLLAGPGRGAALQNYLQRNIFFNDQVMLKNLAPDLHQFSLHGPQVESIIQTVITDFDGKLDIQNRLFNGLEVVLCRVKPLVESQWVLLCPQAQASDVWQSLVAAGVQPAGGLTYNTLRIRSGRPGIGTELSTEYIPLELGLWDEISFTKGCYTGQEIIARMESRRRLARTIVRLNLERPVPATPADLYHEGRKSGAVTSCVVSPHDEIFAIGVVKTALAQSGQVFLLQDGASATVIERLGVQPEELLQD